MLISRLGSGPQPQILDQTRKADQEQTLQLMERQISFIMLTPNIIVVKLFTGIIYKCVK